MTASDKPPAQCASCSHPAHLGPCLARNGGTAYQCPCLRDTPNPVQDKPRADLVALLLMFEAAAEHRATLYLSGNDAGAAVLVWADLRGHHVRREIHTRRDAVGKDVAWTALIVADTRDLPGWEVTCSLHDDHEVTALAPQADQQVLARVQAALDGDPAPCPECDGPADHCADCGVPNGRPHEVFCHQQPEAAQGSV